MTEKFRGRYSLKADAKGRVALPTSVRDTLGSRTKLVITNSLYKNLPHLDVYTMKRWEALEGEIDQLPSLRPEVQAFQRFYLASGTPVDVDGQGRALIPYELRQYAQIKSDIVIVGMGDRFEIWDRTIWQKVFLALKKEYDQVMGSVAELKEKK